MDCLDYIPCISPLSADDGNSTTRIVSLNIHQNGLIVFPFSCSKPKLLIRNYLLAKVIDIEADENILNKEKLYYIIPVSWIRHRDIHLLTAGRYTYTSDQRFEAIHEPHSENWSLRIKYPQKKDSGIYECQISTTPPIGHPVYLTVLVWRSVEENPIGLNTADSFIVFRENL
ncbi:hypothetical protein AGLY_003104 [Aphis glycines]|uniref:Ig-like domain-containing protein n=1 Tax=Aphis glycines TaxID=307491 RepID=A0A6G0U2M9_APHGL|nr:hypothetical protein AGLY_003104 [Aphis glycines]